MHYLRWLWLSCFFFYFFRLLQTYMTWYLWVDATRPTYRQLSCCCCWFLFFVILFLLFYHCPFWLDLVLTNPINDCQCVSKIRRLSHLGLWWCVVSAIGLVPGGQEIRVHCGQSSPMCVVHILTESPDRLARAPQPKAVPKSDTPLWGLQHDDLNRSL